MQFRNTLLGDGNAKRVTKIGCFGLGDLNSKPLGPWVRHSDTLPADERETASEQELVDDALVHHAIAMTMANIIRSCAKPGDRAVILLTQDPDYCDATKDLIRDIGFEVVGGCGAGGFAEVDNGFVVFSAFTNAPSKQIITDLARPLAIISIKNDDIDGVWNKRGYLMLLLSL